MPTPAEADLLAKVRRTVSRAISIQIKYTTGRSVFERYHELIGIKKGKAS